MDAKARATFIRRNHRRNGGQFSSTELAQLFGISERTVRAYVANEFCTDPDYSAERGRVNVTLARDMYRAGFTPAMIGRTLGVSARYIQRLFHEREPLCET